MNNDIKEIFDLYEKQADNPDLAILIRTLKEWYFEKENYKSRIVKAIEYIKGWQSFPHTNGSTHNELHNLLNILEGDDKE